MYNITKDNKFVIENYNWKTSFSNFFPGIAGELGIPMWIYYVSRNQCICSFGIKDKNNPIMEFLSFNKALELVNQQGFRTFVKINGSVYEPFKKTKDTLIKQNLIVSSSELEIVEINKKLGLEFKVLYFPITDTFYPALVRKLTIKKIKPGNLKIEILDGLPKIYPKGVNLHCVNTIARHIEGMMNVEFSRGIPLFRLKQSPEDTEQVSKIDGANFYLSFKKEDKKLNHGKYVIDPELIFGESEIYQYPWNFNNKSIKEILKLKQIKQNKTPCAFTATEKKINKKKPFELISLIGNTITDKMFLNILKDVSKKNYINEKRIQNIKSIEQIKNFMLTSSGDRKFDEYSKQTFLDNVIRGGMPVVFNTAEGKSAFYVYSRQNGDLERDYHNFVVDPTYFSQGTGHYRSVNQNRRCDTWFFPEVGDKNIKLFVNLTQTDGYNPLEITQMRYTIKKQKQFQNWIRKLGLNKNTLQKLKKITSKPFSPGEFLIELEKNNFKIRKNYRKIVSSLLSFSSETECAEIHEGYWVDHWLYNFDLIDVFLMIYPDKLDELLIRNNDYYFYDNPDIINPISEKYVLVDGKVRRYGSVRRDHKKFSLIKSRKVNPYRVRTNYGHGKIYYTNLFVKILCMCVNRLATIDPAGTGIEMEADKPGWNDSMNGLPGIVGSSLCQMIELEKALKFLDESLLKLKISKIKVYEELAWFIENLEKVIEKKLSSNLKGKNFVYWREANKIKEEYREKTIFGISGKEKEYQTSKIQNFVKKALKIFSIDNKKIMRDNVPYTYFENKVIKYKKTGRFSCSGHPLVIPLQFKQIPLPLFLEGPVHMLKVHKELNKKIYSAVKKSKIYDKKLKMYKVCEPLDKAPFEIGRVKAWGPGWIENESIYTHMLYKYLLEVLRSGLYSEFFEDIKTMFMHNLDPKKYDRSILENVSFIVSSAFPDEKMHGRGLQPRLSGVTGEMITMWILMTAGLKPFYLEDNKLIFELSPILESSFFTKKPTESKIKLPKNSFAFKFLGKIIVIYKNNKRRNTFGADGVKPISYVLYYKNKTKKINSSKIKEPYSFDIREGKVRKIFVELS